MGRQTGFRVASGYGILGSDPFGRFSKDHTHGFQDGGRANPIGKACTTRCPDLAPPGKDSPGILPLDSTKFVCTQSRPLQALDRTQRRSEREIGPEHDLRGTDERLQSGHWMELAETAVS